MHNSYVIEVSGEEVGLIFRNDGERAFRFHAVASPFSALNGQRFPDPLTAERSAAALARKRAKGGKRNIG